MFPLLNNSHRFPVWFIHSCFRYEYSLRVLLHSPSMRQTSKTDLYRPETGLERQGAHTEENQMKKWTLGV